MFRADVDAVHHVDDFDHSLDGVNTVLSGDEDDFKNFVQDAVATVSHHNPHHGSSEGNGLADP